MTRQIRVRGIKRKHIDEDKLALAFLMLARTIHKERQAAEHGYERHAALSDEATSDASEAA